MKQKAQPYTRFLLRVTLERVLTFGPSPMVLEMGDLNVLIGPNASGKSNFIEALSLMRSTPVRSSKIDLRGTIGGASEWMWKGESAAASIDSLVHYPGAKQGLQHFLSLETDQQMLRLVDEGVGYGKASAPTPDLDFYYRFQRARGVRAGGRAKSLERESVDPDSSILSQRRDPKRYPEFAHLADAYEKIRIYRDWTVGRKAVCRKGQPTDIRNDRLEEDFSNLGVVLSRLRKTPRVKEAILKGLKDLYEGVTDYEPVVEGGGIQIFFTEGDFSVSATRLSDGALRYLCLLAILCDPEPPPVICIEEPELGLHPDILPKLADLLMQASLRTQLIVATHSDALVDALTCKPETVIVCEKSQGQTTMTRLDKEELAVWLQKYSLGQLWTRGHLGGTRW